MLILLIFLFPCIFSQFRTQNFLFTTPENCTEQQYFNRIDLRCETCPNSTIPSKSGLECNCAPNQKEISRNLFVATCQDCPDGSFSAPDHSECLVCRNGSSCQCSGSQNLLVFRQENGNLMTEGAFCDQCANGFEVGKDGRCQKCGDQCKCQNCTNSEQVYTRIKLQNGIEMKSTFIENHLSEASRLCGEQRKVQFCESLVNMCVLQNYESTSSLNACGLLETIRRSFNPWQNALDPVDTSDDSELEKDNVIDHQYTFSQHSYLELVFARYSLNGSFDGFLTSESIFLHFCGQSLHPFAAFRFGRKFKKACRIRKSAFSDPNIVGKFFEVFLKFSDEQGTMKMYPLQILNSAVRTNNQLLNFANRDRNRWVLTRRFFLIDDFSMSFDNSTQLIRVAANIAVNVVLQKSRDGFINPPYLSIEYDDSTDDVIDTHLEVIYHKDPSGFDQKLIIFICILVPFSLFCSGINCYSWSRRQGKVSPIDPSSIVYFFVCETAILGDVFFALFALIAGWTTFAYKNQTYVLYNMLSDEQQRFVFAFVIAALVLKFFGLVFTMGALVFQETFFIDWERQKLKQTDGIPLSRDLLKSSETEPVVVWRTYLIANEWNELQQYRKSSLALQCIMMILLMEYFQFKNYALVEPNFERNNVDPSTTQKCLVTTLAVTIFTYLSLALFQVIGKVLVVERILTDPFHNFVDLCSVSNISVLSLTHSLYGFYIHGRSVHGKGDAGMSEMNEFLQRERNNLCGFRGLEPGSELQTFTVNLPHLFRTKYDEIAAISNQTTSGVVGHEAITAKMNATVEAHSQMNTFLKNFVDHSITEMDYVVRDRPVLEAVLNLEMGDSSVTGSFTRDPAEIAYSQCFVYGNEWAWTSFECLTVCVFFVWSDSIHLAVFVAYVVSHLLRLLFGYLSTNHLIKTSLVDQRFLC